MHRTLPLFALALAAVALMALPVAAQTGEGDPAGIGRYRFLPRFSVLTQTGGFAGGEVDFRVRGTFDLVDPVRMPNVDGVPHFRNVDAWASHPILAYVQDLDETLNMSGLLGRQLPVMAPFNVYEFRGKTFDGSAVRMLAAEIGPWLRLRGETTAPPGSADFFEYELRALARRRPFADFDDNNAVDRSDLATWMERFGAASPALGLWGDADGDKLVDGADFLSWQRTMGEEPPPTESLDAMVSAALATISPSATAIPEPSTMVLGVAGLAGLAALRRWRQ